MTTRTIKNIRGLLIDPFNQSVQEIQTTSDLKGLKASMSLEDGLIDIVSFGSMTDMVIDDEGLLKDNQRYFTFQGLNSLFCGKALLVGHDQEGDTVSLDMAISRELVQSRTLWLGSASNTEKSITLGLIDRPCTKINGEVIWEWSGNDYREERAQS